MMRSADTIVQEILASRGIAGNDGAVFLHPDFKRDLHHPSALLGMNVACERIVKAIKEQQKVVVFGDYDADGIPATALMVRGLAACGLVVTPLIPARADGYGLTEIAVAIIAQQKPDLVITVDNGTVSKAEVAELSEYADVIIIDHHEPHPDRLATAALAIINPKQENCTYPFKELCACGLVWKTLSVVYEALGISPEPLKWHLDLVALSTVADMVPLVGENRVLVSYGLKVLAKSRNKGLVALAHVAGMRLETASAGDIGFKIAPRINAPSRMHLEVVDGNNAALQLLITEDASQADTLAQYLNAQNNERQALVEAHLDEAFTQAEAQRENKVLAVYHKDWSTGVIGLVASRLVEKYKRPVIVMAPEGDEIKGSVRSVGNVPALDLLEAATTTLKRFGGHAKAAGLTLDPVSTPEEFAQVVQTAGALEPHTLETLQDACARQADLTIHLEEATGELADALQELAPYGLGFPTPLFHSQVTLANSRPVGKDKQHMSCFLEEGSAKRKAIAFRQPCSEMEDGEVYDVQYYVENETWNGVTSPSCVIQSIKKAPKGA